mmetsp:Transcript_31832/g.83415  ORF Transcript_31832/g.83415 Transcript_31832/m.83415 type:complete len:255 (+) Transcript_31832:1183-1947(+)
MSGTAPRALLISRSSCPSSGGSRRSTGRSRRTLRSRLHFSSGGPTTRLPTCWSCSKRSWEERVRAQCSTRCSSESIGRSLWCRCYSWCASWRRLSFHSSPAIGTEFSLLSTSHMATRTCQRQAGSAEPDFSGPPPVSPSQATRSLTVPPWPEVEVPLQRRPTSSSRRLASASNLCRLQLRPVPRLSRTTASIRHFTGTSPCSPLSLTVSPRLAPPIRTSSTGAWHPPLWAACGTAVETQALLQTGFGSWSFLAA